LSRILIIAPVGSALHLPIEVRQARLGLPSATELEVRHIIGVPPSVFVPPEEVFLPRLLAEVARGATEGFDAIGISCCSDPGLDECRAVSDVPVSAPFDAVMSRSAEFGTLGILYLAVPPAPGESATRGEEWIPELIERYRPAGEIVATLPVPVVRPDVDFSVDGATADAVGEALFAAMRGAMDSVGIERARDAEAAGARALFPTCTYWSGTLDRVRGSVHIPVLDPLTELARHLEELAA
jgi:Asp/Glu/hydantoin racemase